MHDPHFDKVVFQLSGYGHGVYPLDDESNLNRRPTYAVGVTRDTTSKYGGGIRLSDLSTYIKFPGVPEDVFGIGDFTIEFWYKMYSYRPAAQAATMIGNTVHPWYSSNSWGVNFINNKMEFWTYTKSNAADLLIASAGGFNELDTPVHVAIVRRNGIVYMYKNGTLVATKSIPDALNSTNSIRIGSRDGGDRESEIDGSIEDIRITNGVARYTEDFTPTQLYPQEKAFKPEYFSGAGKIAGTVKVKGIPLTNAECMLFTETTNALISRTETDASGKFEFTGLNKNELFYVVVKQNEPTWEHIVSSRRNPA